MDKFPKYDYYHYLNFIYNFIWYINYYILQQQIMASFGDDSLLLNIKTNIKKKPQSSAEKPQSKINPNNKALFKKEKYNKKFKNSGTEKKVVKFDTSYDEKILKPKGRRMPENQEGQYPKKNYSEQKNRKRFNNKRETESGPSNFVLPTSQIHVNQIMPEEQNKEKFIDNFALEGFDLVPQLKSSLEQKGIQKLTQIQSLCYQSIFNRSDSVIKARTGSGKTLAYLIPLINKYLLNKTITARKDGTVLMTVCPTRQLCIQAQKQAQRCLKRCPFIVAGCLTGGEDINHEKARIRKGINLLFCTPGKVLYHLENTKSFSLSNLQTIVFEEADRTLDLGFEETTKKIIKILQQKIALTHVHKILVSAHFNSKVSSLLEKLNMNEPKFLGFSSQSMRIENLQEQKDQQINTSNQLKQQYALIAEQEKIPFIFSYVGLIKDTKILIFVSTIDEVQYLDCLFSNLKFKDSNGVMTTHSVESRPIFKIHGDLDQKLRTNTYMQFRKSKNAIMISTEVASRGLDFPDLSHIILFDVPPSITDYGNRVGRSARFNNTGVSLLLLHYQESDYAQKIRFFCPQLENINRDTIYDNYNKVLRQMNIGDRSLHYIEGLIRSFVKDDDEKYQLARKAYVSMLRAYSRLKQRHIFAAKKLNLKMLARTFGLNSANAGDNYHPKAKVSHMEIQRKKRKVQSTSKLQVSQYM